MTRDWNVVTGTIGAMMMVGGLISILALAIIKPPSLTAIIISGITGALGIIVIAIALSKK